jgi:hypothetical protein
VRAASAAVPCEPAVNEYDRTRLCWQVRATVTAKENGKAAGTLTFDITHSMTLGARSRDFAEHITVSHVAVQGAAGGIAVALSVSCATPCAATNHFPHGETVRDGLTGTISYRDSVAPGREASAKTTYVFAFAKPGYESAGFRYQTPVSYRCDDALPGVSAAGCVFPSYAPALAALTSMADVAGNIAAAQDGTGHYGLYGGGHPLIRITSAAAQRANYAAVCGTSVVGAPPSKGAVCEEYPFSSTAEGGTSVGAQNRRTTWVPSARQDAVSEDITAFYAANRILNGDAFWVSV